MKFQSEAVDLSGPLTELHFKLFESDFDGAHDASIDDATARCFFELIKKAGSASLKHWYGL